MTAEGPLLLTLGVLLAVLVWRLARPVRAQPKPPRTAELLPRLRMTEDRVISFALEYTRRAFDDEERRRSTLDTKATTLVSALGVTAAFVLGAGGLLASSVATFPPALLPALITVYFFILVSLGIALVRGLSVLRVRYRWAYPDPEDVFDFLDDTFLNARRGVIASTVVSLLRNSRNNDRRAEDLDQGHMALSMAVAGLLALGGITGWGILLQLPLKPP